jgi:hypothetical protein
MSPEEGGELSRGWATPHGAQKAEALRLLVGTSGVDRHSAAPEATEEREV